MTPYLAKAVANLFLDFAKEAGDDTHTPLKIQKLVYYAHGWHLGLSGTALVQEDVEAWPHGPVIPELYHEFKHFGNKPITSPATEFVWQTPKGVGKLVDLDQVVPIIGKEDPIWQFLKRFWESYSPQSAYSLSNATHAPGTPWYEVWLKFKDRGGIPKNTVIENESIRKHFEQLAKS